MPHPTITTIPLKCVGALLGHAANYGWRNREKLGASGNPPHVSVARIEEIFGPQPAEAIARACGAESTTPASPKFGALSTADFCRAYSCSRSTMWREAKAGRLVVRKRGDKNIVLVSEAEAWARSLPVAGGAAAQ